MSVIKAPVDEANKEGKSPLKIAEERGSVNATKMLLRQGAVPDDIVQETKIREMFCSSLLRGIDVPVAGANGARMWDIIENFARQRTSLHYFLSLVFFIFISLS